MRSPDLQPKVSQRPKDGLVLPDAAANAIVQPKLNRLNRRDFLTRAGAGLFLLGTGALRPSLASAQDGPGGSSEAIEPPPNPDAEEQSSLVGSPGTSPESAPATLRYNYNDIRVFAPTSNIPAEKRSEYAAAYRNTREWLGKTLTNSDNRDPELDGVIDLLMALQADENLLGDNERFVIYYTPKSYMEENLKENVPVKDPYSVIGLSTQASTVKPDAVLWHINLIAAVLPGADQRFSYNDPDNNFYPMLMVVYNMRLLSKGHLKIEEQKAAGTFNRDAFVKEFNTRGSPLGRSLAVPAFQETIALYRRLGIQDPAFEALLAPSPSPLPRR